ncbi:hypothetical protein GGI11_008298, partial [Coemansia sp. RSA 2049]
MNIRPSEIYKLTNEIVATGIVAFQRAAGTTTITSSCLEGAQPTFGSVVVPLANFENKCRGHINLMLFLRLVSPKRR